MMSSQFFLLIVLMASSTVYCGKNFKEKLCQPNLSTDVVAALEKCFEQRPPRMVNKTQTCMTQIGKTIVNEAVVRQATCDATDGPKLMKCMRGNTKPRTPTGTGAPQPPPGGSVAPLASPTGTVASPPPLTDSAAAPPPSTGTGAPKPLSTGNGTPPFPSNRTGGPTVGSRAPRFKYQECIRNALAL